MTIAQQLKITEFPFEIKDSKGNQIYFEDSNGFWERREYDASGNLTHYEDFFGFWAKKEFDANGDWTYFEDSNGYWAKQEYDSNGNVSYYENSNGKIINNRPKTDVQKAIELLTKEGLLVDGKVIK
jgi:hypothetical protein